MPAQAPHLPTVESIQAYLGTGKNSNLPLTLRCARVLQLPSVYLPLLTARQRPYSGEPEAPPVLISAGSANVSVLLRFSTSCGRFVSVAVKLSALPNDSNFPVSPVLLT